MNVAFLPSREDFGQAETWCILVVFLGGGTLALTLLQEYGFGLEPCSLCLTQRYFMFLGVLFAGWGLLTEPRRGIFPVLSIVSFIGGAGYALRQLWLQYVPGASSDCGAGVTFLLENEYPFASVLKSLFEGSVDCAEPSLIPIFSLVAFVILVGISVQQLRLGPRSH